MLISRNNLILRFTEIVFSESDLPKDICSLTRRFIGSFLVILAATAVVLGLASIVIAGLVGLVLLLLGYKIIAFAGASLFMDCAALFAFGLCYGIERIKKARTDARERNRNIVREPGLLKAMWESFHDKFCTPLEVSYDK